MPVLDGRVVLYRTFEISRAVNVFPSFGITQVFRSGGFIQGCQIILTRVLVVIIHLVIIWIIVAGYAEIRITGGIEQTSHRQSLQQEVQILMQFYLCKHQRLVIFLVTPDQVGVGIDIITCAIITEENMSRVHIGIIRLVIGGEQNRIGLQHRIIDRRTTVDRAVVIVKCAV